MAAPADYAPLSAAESETLRELLRKATLVDFIAPENQSPIAWIAELDFNLHRHVERWNELTGRMKEEHRLAAMYDPRNGKAMN
jgi:hypothetical protein